MATCGPFETGPRLAVAVSGGADSMALCLLAQAWAEARGGRIIALTVDHRLRTAAAAEARQVRGWLAGRGIDHEILCWDGVPPLSGIEAKARTARYRLLSDACRRKGVLHLLVGHHLHDQVETVMMRRAAGSGALGLAAMAAVVETGVVRVVRPLLSVHPSQLRAYLLARGQAWIEDPANRDERFARSRIRLGLSSRSADAPEVEAAAALAAGCAVARAADEVAVATLLARHGRLHAAGFAILDPAALAAAPLPVASLALARIAMTIGGTRHAPGADALGRLRARLAAGVATTLGRCRWQWWTERRAGGETSPGILVCREARGLPPPADLADLAAGGAWTWDGRFDVRVAAVEPGCLFGLRLGPLGETGWLEAVGIDPALRQRRLPRPCARTLPAVRDRAGLVAIPTLDWWPAPRGEAARAVRVVFNPLRNLSGAGSVLA